MTDEAKMAIAIAVATISFIALGFMTGFWCGESEAMAQCLMKHSTEVCQHTLKP